MGLITHPHTSHNQSNWGIIITLFVSLEPLAFLSNHLCREKHNHHHQPSLKIFNHFKVPDQMEASFLTSSSLRKRAPLRCYYAEKPMLVVSWTIDNPSRRFYGCPNYWVFQFEYFVLLGFNFFV